MNKKILLFVLVLVVVSLSGMVSAIWWGPSFGYRSNITNITTGYAYVVNSTGCLNGGNSCIHFLSDRITNNDNWLYNTIAGVQGNYAVANDTNELNWFNATNCSGNNIAGVYNAMEVLSFEQKTGNQTTDCSGRENTGTCFGVPGQVCNWTTSGRFGYGLQMDKNSRYVRIPATVQPMTFNWSLEAWTKAGPQTLSGGAIAGLDTGGVTGRWTVWIGIGGKAQAFFRDYASNEISLTGTTTVSDNNWHQIAVTRDIVADVFTLYVDGKNDTASVTDTSTRNITSTLDYLGVGCWYGSAIEPAYCLNGTIDEFRIYNRSLSAAEIQEHYQLGIGNRSQLMAEESASVVVPSINLSLVSPLNNTYTNLRNVNFTYVPSTNNANNITNSSLWTNITSVFAITQWNETGVINGSLNGINSSLNDYEGSLIWNIQACAGNTCNFSESNRTLIVDTINPAISITTPTNNQYLNSKLVSINGTVIDAYLNYTNISIYNLSGTLINSTINYSIIATLLGVQEDGNYTINITAYDNATNYNSTTINITVDTTNPSISFISPTESNNTYFNRIFIAVNVSVTETNFANITFYLYNSSTQLNVSNFSVLTTGINFTNLDSNMQFWYNVTVRDSAGNSNTTETRTLTLDNTNPSISFSSGTEANNTIWSRTSIYINLTITETNFNNITFYLFNSTTQINATTFTTLTTNINFTNLSDEQYRYNVSIYDSAGNWNSTDTRKITLDTTPPTISNQSLESTSINTNGSVILNATVTDINSVDTVKFYIRTPHGNYNISAGSNLYITCNATAQCATNMTGQYNWTSIWANDSVGNINSTSISFQFNVSNATVSTYMGAGRGAGGKGASTPESTPYNINETTGIRPFVITPRHLDEEGKDTPARAIMNSSDIAIYQIIFEISKPIRIWIEGNDYELSSGYKINSKDMVIISPEGTLDVQKCPKFDSESGLCIWEFQIVSKLPPDATGTYFADVWVISGNYQEKIQVELQGTKQYQYSDWVGYFNIPLWSGVVLGRDITLYSWMFLPMLVLVFVAHRVWQYMKVLAYKRRFGARDKAEKLRRATKT